MKRIILQISCLLVITCSTQVSAQNIIKMKNGSIVKGVINQSSDSLLTITGRDGSVFKIIFKDVASIGPDSSFSQTQVNTPTQKQSQKVNKTANNVNQPVTVTANTDIVVLEKSIHKGCRQSGVALAIQAGSARVSSGAYSQSGGGFVWGSQVQLLFGMSDKISLTGYLNNYRGSYSVFDGVNLSTSTVGVSLAPRYYFINQKEYNLGAGLGFGFSFGRGSYNDKYNTTASMGGINYSFSGGGNWYFKDWLGLSADLGISGASISGVFNSTYSSITTKKNTESTKISSMGLYFSVGLVIHRKFVPKKQK